MLPRFFLSAVTLKSVTLIGDTLGTLECVTLESVKGGTRGGEAKERRKPPGITLYSNQ